MFKTSNKETLLKVYIMIVVPIHIYGYENCALTKHKKWSETVETTFMLEAIHLHGKKTNEEIKKMYTV
jgi:hypothetical protein